MSRTKKNTALDLSKLNEKQLLEIKEKLEMDYNHLYPFLVYENEYHNAQGWLVSLRNTEVVSYEVFAQIHWLDDEGKTQTPREKYNSWYREAMNHEKYKKVFYNASRSIKTQVKREIKNGTE